MVPLWFHDADPHAEEPPRRRPPQAEVSGGPERAQPEQRGHRGAPGGRPGRAGRRRGPHGPRPRAPRARPRSSDGCRPGPVHARGTSVIVVDTNVIAYFWLEGDHTALAERVMAWDDEWAAP